MKRTADWDSSRGCRTAPASAHGCCSHSDHQHGLANYFGGVFDGPHAYSGSCHCFLCFFSLRPVRKVGHRDGDDLVQSTVWAASVVTNSALVVSSDVSAEENTGIAIVNPSNF